MKNRLRDTRTLLQDVNEFLHIPPTFIDRCGWNLISAYCSWTVLFFMILVHWNPCFIEGYKWSLHLSSKFSFQLRWHSVQKNSTGVRYACWLRENMCNENLLYWERKRIYVCICHIYCPLWMNFGMTDLCVVGWTCALSTWVQGRSWFSYGSKLS
jgi:hypothetical protein